MKEYRTVEQFNTIADSAINGNWSTAFKEVEQFGFFADDLIECFNNDDSHGLDWEAIVYLAQGGQKERGE
jgi:hypothetical protein